jgi:lipopolysaccharide transport system ATP-binding protein
MSKTIIKVENLGKLYSIGEKQKFYTLRDSITSFFNFGNNKKVTGDFWALKDIDFEVKQGESVGIIGRNGAGKSTLLKILSRITPPTIGKITLHGRVASLLEVGTGFHQELTGRENIFLNGAILGMGRSEIKHKFDEIVEFSEVGKFLDMPVKHYSSGMFMRLAFAVAAHLESEILIVDEVLAVGDVQFQKKCLGKMSAVSKEEGRTVLFVSHDADAIKRLCTNCILLDEGKITASGITEEILDKYIGDLERMKKMPISLRKDRSGEGKVILTNMSYGSNNRQDTVSSGDDIFIELELINKTAVDQSNIEIAIEIRRRDNSILLYLGTRVLNRKVRLSAHERGKWRCIIPNLPLEPGKYKIMAEIMVDRKLSDVIEHVFDLNVAYGDYYKSGFMWPVSGLLCQYEWKSVK